MSYKNKEDEKKYMKEYCFKNRNNKKEYDKEYRKANREKILERQKKYYQKNKEKILEYQKIYNQKNKEEILKRSKRYYQSNKDRIIKYQSEYCQKRMKTNLKYNLNKKISRVIKLSLNGNKNGWHWEELVGYTLNDLIKRLKKTMPEGYTWNDFIEGKLHIDHIIPKSLFNYTKPDDLDFKRCWALRNLQLLPAEENLKKFTKLIKPFQLGLNIKIKEVSNEFYG
jgi:hypothetical protein